MCESSDPRRDEGFSLVEMMVALVFLSLLMVGMLRVFSSSLASFMANNETLGVQRNTRWGLNQLQEQVLEAGFLFPLRPAPGGLMAGSSFQPPLLMQSTGYTPEGATAPVDELQAVMDIPLNVQGTSTAAIAVGDVAFTATIPSGAAAVEAGDLVLIEDAGAEFPTVSSVTGSGSTVTINLKATESSGIDPVTGTPVNFMSPTGGFKNAHLAGMPFTVIRPNQVVRFTVVPRNLDPGDPGASVPCLVRQSRTLVPGEIWAPGLSTPAANEQVLLENVTGFAVDWSIDGGRNWLRATGGDSWAGIRAVLDSAMTAPGTSPYIRQSGGVNNPSLPMWTLYTPILVRIDLATRSVMQRTEFNMAYNPASPQAAYRTRRETLMLSPRNFGIGLN